MFEGFFILFCRLRCWLLWNQSIRLLCSFIFCLNAWVLKFPPKGCAGLVFCDTKTLPMSACAFSISTKSFSRLTQQFIYVVSQWRRQLNLSTRRTLFNGFSLWKRNCRSVSNVICKLDWCNWSGEMATSTWILSLRFANAQSCDLWSCNSTRMRTISKGKQHSSLFLKFLRFDWHFSHTF